MDKDDNIESFRKRMKASAERFGITYPQMLQIFRSNYSFDIVFDYDDPIEFCDEELKNEGVEAV